MPWHRRVGHSELRQHGTALGPLQCYFTIKSLESLGQVINISQTQVSASNKLNELLVLMAHILPPTVRLNNHFQGINQIWAISYVELDLGPNVENRWSITVNIYGVEKGSCRAARKPEAKEAAAQEALTRLGIP